MPMHSERYPYNHQENGDYPHEENHGYENYEEHEREDASGYTRQYNTYEGDHYPEEHSYDYDYDHEQGFDDQNHDDESHYQHDQAEYFNEANGFVIAGGTFSSVAGSVYHDGYTYSAHSHPSAYASHPQRPPIGQHRTSFFKRASNFRIEDGDFLSVGGDVHGLRQPSRPRPPQRAPEPVPHGPRMGMGAPRGRGAYDGYSYGPQPRGNRAAHRANHLGVFDQERHHAPDPAQRYADHGGGPPGSQHHGGSNRTRPSLNPPQRSRGTARARGSPPFRPPSPSPHFQEYHGHEYDVPMQEEESNPTIHIVSPTQSHGRSTPPSPVREHTDSAADISNTKVRSVTAQLGGLSLQVSSQRSSALHVQSDSNPGPKSAATSIAINPSLSPVSYTLAGQPLNPYPSPQSTLRLSLDRASEFVQGSSTSSMTSSQESHVPGPSITSILTNDSGSQSMHTVEKNKTKKFQVFGALGFKKKKAERKL